MNALKIFAATAFAGTPLVLIHVHATTDTCSVVMSAKVGHVQMQGSTL